MVDEYHREYYKNNIKKMKMQHRDYYLKHRQDRLLKIAQNHRELRLKYIELLGSKCEKCGYNKCISVLEFHHTKGKTRSEEKTFASKIFKERLEKNEIMLLCANCHKEIHYSQSFRATGRVSI